MLQKPTPGQPASKSVLASAAFVSDLVDVRNAFRQSDLGSPSNSTSLAIPTDLVKVKNITGNDLERFRVVQLGAHLLDEIDFRNLWFEADEVASPAADRFAILREPIKDTKIGWAQVTGVCVAYVDVLDTDHTRATPKIGSTALESAATGPVEILSPVASTGEQELIVRFLVPTPGTTGYLFATRGSGPMTVAGAGPAEPWESWSAPTLKKGADGDGISKFTIETPGIWEAHASMSIFAANGGTGAIDIVQYDSGDTEIDFAPSGPGGSDTALVGLSVSGIFNCAVGDYLVVRCAFNGDLTNDLEYYGGSFTMHLIEAA